MEDSVVITDGRSVNFLLGGQAWDEIRRYAQVTCYDHTEPGELMQRAVGANVIVVNKTRIACDQLRQLVEAGLMGIVVSATGFDNLSEIVDYAKQIGFPVLVARRYAADAVADMTLLHVLNMARRFNRLCNGVKAGGWCGPQFNCIPPTNSGPYKPVSLRGKVLGLLGVGDIGEQVAVRAQAFGMQVWGYDPFAPEDAEFHRGVKMFDRSTILQRADFVSLHCPYQGKPEIGADELAAMRNSAFLINTARGALVDEDALSEALISGSIAGASIDVRCVEPALTGTDPLRNLVDCTGHNGWYTTEAVMALVDITTQNVKSILDGCPDPGNNVSL